MFLTLADFTGYYLISTDNWDEAKLIEAIDTYEKIYLQDLLGVTLYDLLVADLTGAPLTPAPPPLTARFISIYGELAYDNTNVYYDHWDSHCGCGGIRRSEGIKTMLKGFIYWHYINLQPIKNTPTGPVENVNENSKKLDSRQAGIVERYNRAIDSYHAIRHYININTELYPEFRGVQKRKFIFGQ